MASQELNACFLVQEGYTVFERIGLYSSIT